MQRPLHEHILSLETMTQDFRDRLMRGGLSDSEREDILAKIQFANDALTHYRQAYEIEYVLKHDDTTRQDIAPERNKKL